MVPPLDPDRQLPSRRHERGRAHLAAVINTWLGRSSLSHDQLSAIADWSLRESGKLGSSQISHIRNARIRNPSIMLIEALAAVNATIWRWQTKGQAACIEALGPYSTFGIQPEWLDGAIWLAHPEHQDEPLCFGDFAELFAGYLVMPDIAVRLSVSDGPELSRALTAIVQAIWAEKGWGLEGTGKILAAYPSDDPDRRSKLVMVLGQQADYTSEEFEDELADLALMLEALRGQEPGSLGPDGLHAELTSGRRRS